MKTTLAAASLATLAACSAPSSGPAAWGYRPGESAPAVISESEFNSLTEQLTDLRNQRAELQRVASRTADPLRRAEHVRGIEKLDSMIAPIEYRLRAAGRPLPPMPPM